MLVACWSVKGGSGTTVVAVALATLLARSSADGAGGVLVADLAGDGPAVLGVPDPTGAGLAGWLAAGPEVPADALARLELAGPGGLRLLPWGPPGTEEPPGAGPRGAVLAGLLAVDPRPVVADCGPLRTSVARAVVAAAAHSLLVLRPCYLSLRHALRLGVRPSGIVLVGAVDRALGAADVESVLGAPVLASVADDAAVARAVDAGVLGSRLPRSLGRSLRPALPHVA